MLYNRICTRDTNYGITITLNKGKRGKRIFKNIDGHDDEKEN